MLWWKGEKPIESKRTDIISTSVKQQGHKLEL